MERSRASIKCCVNLLILKWACGRTAPVRGSSSPVMIFSRVDFPGNLCSKNFVRFGVLHEEMCDSYDEKNVKVV